MDWISFLSGFSGTAIAGIGLILTVKDRPVPVIEIWYGIKYGMGTDANDTVTHQELRITNQGLHPLIGLAIKPMCQELFIAHLSELPPALQTTDEPYRIECTWPQQHAGPLPLLIAYTVAGQHPRRRNLLLLDVGNWSDKPMWYSPAPRWWALDHIRHRRKLLIQKQADSPPPQITDIARLQQTKRSVQITTQSSTGTEQG